MIQLDGADSIYLDESLVGFTKQLTNDGVVDRQVDLLLVGAAYAICHRLPPLDKLRRHDLLRVASLDPDVRLALEAGLAWYARELQLPQPMTAKDLLSLLARTGSAGLSRLRGEWRNLTPGQLRLRLFELRRPPTLAQGGLVLPNTLADH